MRIFRENLNRSFQNKAQRSLLAHDKNEQPRTSHSTRFQGVNDRVRDADNQLTRYFSSENPQNI